MVNSNTTQRPPSTRVTPTSVLNQRLKPESGVEGNKKETRKQAESKVSKNNTASQLKTTNAPILVQRMEAAHQPHHKARRMKAP